MVSTTRHFRNKAGYKAYACAHLVFYLFCKYFQSTLWVPGLTCSLGHGDGSDPVLPTGSLQSRALDGSRFTVLHSYDAGRKRTTMAWCLSSRGGADDVPHCPKPVSCTFLTDTPSSPVTWYCCYPQLTGEETEAQSPTPGW